MSVNGAFALFNGHRPTFQVTASLSMIIHMLGVGGWSGCFSIPLYKNGSIWSAVEADNLSIVSVARRHQLRKQCEQWTCLM